MPMRFTLAACLCLVLAACTTTPPIERVSGMPPLDRSAVAGVSVDDFAAETFTASDGTVLPYRLLAPSTLEAGRRYPLVVQFHGSGGIGNDNLGQLENAAKAWALPAIRARYPAFVLVPQFPARSAGYDDPATPRIAHATLQLQAALELIETVVAQQPVARGRIYATGFSMGGSASWLALLARPNLFAAAVPMSGIAPERRHAKALAGIPLLVLHGDADDENPIDSDREMVAAIRAAGGSKVRLREYAGLAHRAPAELVPGDWWRDWLFTQHRSP